MYTQRLLSTSIRSHHELQSHQSTTSSPRPYDGRTVLVPNMVLTVEPGLYFSRYALENFYLKVPQHAKYINAPLLEKYYPVGGVRIEDDILVTESGWENLTTAPKGEEACGIIRGELS
jgi:Xaa-Pro dipeptidase